MTPAGLGCESGGDAGATPVTPGFASLRAASLRFASLRSAPLPVASHRFASLRSAPLRFASLRSSFRALPFRMRIPEDAIYDPQDAPSAYFSLPLLTLLFWFLLHEASFGDAFLHFPSERAFRTHVRTLLRHVRRGCSSFGSQRF